MTRVMLLVPVLLVVGVWVNRSRDRSQGAPDVATSTGKLAIPWFALGFLALVIVNSLHALPGSATHTLNMLDTFALTMAMTALGIETRMSQIREAGPRALATGFILYAWLIGGGLAITMGVSACSGKVASCARWHSSPAARGLSLCMACALLRNPTIVTDS